VTVLKQRGNFGSIMCTREATSLKGASCREGQAHGAGAGTQIAGVNRQHV
jgi:hypothetical protein